MPGAKGMQGVALAAVGTGVLLVWSGIKGWSLTGTLKDLITGVDPTTQQNVNPITDTPAAAGGGGSGGGGGGGTTSGAAIAARAKQDIGHCYSYGGSAFKARRNLPSGGTGKIKSCWDCSSAVNWWLASLGFAIPGYKPGTYDGTVHGPPTGSWLTWSGCKTIKKADIQAGDILVSTTHMGIAVSRTEMISAENPKNGTRIDPISAFSGLRARRLKAVTGTGPGGTGPAPKGSYTHAGLMTLWKQAGGRAAAASNAACHAIQESGGNPRATSSNPGAPGCVNVGLWQLATPCGKGAGHTVAQLRNPLLNARLAIKGSNNGRDWSAWATPGC